MVNSKFGAVNGRSEMVVNGGTNSNKKLKATSNMEHKTTFKEAANRGKEWNQLKVPARLGNIESRFCYRDIWKFLHFKGIELYGKNFRLFEEDVAIIVQLICAVLKDEMVAPQYSLDLEKGILLTGPVGCGKTSLMNLLRYLLPMDSRHRLYSCREISFEYSRDGHTAIHRYTKGSFSVKKFEPIIYCFDDLGLENETQDYGATCQVMAEIILSRYDYYHSFGMQTHLTTNLNSSEIEKQCGLRARSRLREMFNLIAFPAETRDKRR
jgi:DNA replication protein DnaC